MSLSLPSFLASGSLIRSDLITFTTSFFSAIHGGVFRLVVKTPPHGNAHTTFHATHEAKSTQLIYEYRPFATAQKDEHKSVRSSMTVFQGRFVATSQSISFKGTIGGDINMA